MKCFLLFFFRTAFAPRNNAYGSREILRHWEKTQMARYAMDYSFFKNDKNVKRMTAIRIDNHYLSFPVPPINNLFEKLMLNFLTFFKCFDCFPFETITNILY